MDRVYRMKVRLTSYDVGPDRTLKPSSLLRIIQEVAGRHLEQDGLSYEHMRSKGIVFLLARECVKIKSHPHCEETITAETWFHKCEGVRFVRNVRLLNEGGQVLIEAATQWIITDPETHKILRPSEFTFSMPRIEENCVNLDFRKIKMPQGAAAAGTRAVRWSDIDCNCHMNNTVYADIICDFFPGGMFDRKLSEFQIDYSNEALLGDEINVLTAETEDGGCCFEGAVEGKKCFIAFAK
ncbi:MAG TPA: acyl-ACP thioesterase domain-containing protein [Ruminiclostridium sp.]|nr:acyl-ACP thioesterase domain-containing protein [Ruminiclostridium sp.]